MSAWPPLARYATALAGQSWPVAFIDVQALRHNARQVRELAGQHPVRLVTKSLRSVAAIRFLQGLDVGFRGLMCYHPLEAVWLAQQGFDDLLVAYPCHQRPVLSRVAEAIHDGADITLMVDCAAHLAQIDAAAQAHGVRIPVCVDIDLSVPFGPIWFGVRRSPLRSEADVIALWKAAQACAGVWVRGVMGYEAQMAGVPEFVPGKRLQNAAIRSLKRAAAPIIRARRARLVAALRDAGADLALVNGGGSGCIAFTREDPSVTEIAVGSAFFAPHLFDGYDDLALHPAAAWMTEVARRSDAGRVTVTGGGLVASGAVGIDKCPQPWLPAGLHLSVDEGAGEVQTPLHGPAAFGLAVGAPVAFRHAKAGELCERFDQLHVIDADRVIDTWPTYRGAGQVFV